jgi:hypothetical protein
MRRAHWDYFIEEAGKERHVLSQHRCSRGSGLILTTFTVLLAVLMTGSGPAYCEPAEAAAPGEAQTVKDGKEVPAKEINNGFFFNRGAYVPLPYVITVDEEGCKINRILVQQMPKPPEGRPILKEDPGPFKWTPELEAKGMHKSGFVSHACSRFGYWENTYGFEEACKRFESYLKEQPLVVKTAVGGEGDFFIRYWTKDGDVDGFGFTRVKPGGTPAARGKDSGKNKVNDGKTPASKGEEPSTDEERRGKAFEMSVLERAAARMRGTLASGGAIFVGGGLTSMPAGEANRCLPRIYDILTSDLLADEKVAALVKGKLLLFLDPASMRAFVAGFKDTVSLRERMEKLPRAGPAREPAPD